MIKASGIKEYTLQPGIRKKENGDDACEKRSCRNSYLRLSTGIHLVSIKAFS